MRGSRVEIIVTCVILFIGGSVVHGVEFAGGTGEWNDPYLIATVEHLSRIGDNPDLWDRHFRLVADIDLIDYEQANFPVIGYWRDREDNTPFRGSFDGAGHVISRLGIDATGTSRSRLGLFGWIGPQGQVRRLGLQDATLTGGDGSDCLGVLAGGNAGLVTQCFAGGVMVGGENGHAIGGLVGVNSQGEIADSYAMVNTSGGSSAVGGLVGENDRGILTRCHVAAQVGGRYGSGYFGGLVGDDESGRIAGCYFLRSRTLTGYKRAYTSLIASDNDLGIPLQETQMQQRASFVGWDFGDVWTICRAEGYPRLRWEDVACEP